MFSTYNWKASLGAALVVPGIVLTFCMMVGFGPIGALFALIPVGGGLLLWISED